MKQPGSLAWAIPPGEDALVREQQDQARTARENAAARRLEDSEIGDGGELLVNGSLRVTGSLTMPGALASAGALVAATAVNAGTNVTAGNDVISNGRGVFTGGITSVGVAATNVTLLPGSRSIVYVVDATGVIGQTTSSIRYKTELAPVEYTAAQFLDVMPLVFRYIGQLDIRNNPDNPNYDPGTTFRSRWA